MYGILANTGNFSKNLLSRWTCAFLKKRVLKLSVDRYFVVETHPEAIVLMSRHVWSQSSYKKIVAQTDRQLRNAISVHEALT